MAQPVGALRAELSASIAQFADDMGKAAVVMDKFVQKIQKAANNLNQIGSAMSVAITVPLVLIGKQALETADQFEEAMKQISIASGETEENLAKLQKTAESLGLNPDLAQDAKGAAEAIGLLYKNGLSTANVLNGAAEATLTLATANKAELAPSAKLVADLMKQWGLTSADLPGIIDKITGTVKNSKITLDDYGNAVSAAGAFAAGSGVSFDDFNTAIMATSGSFASGEAAATSFRAFIAKLSPTTKQSKQEFKDLGLSFYDASGKIKPLVAIAQELKDKLGGLNEESRNDVMDKIFGRRAMTTAISLMQQGGQGIEDLQKKIDAVSADDTAKKQMDGLEGSVTRFKKAITGIWDQLVDDGVLDFLAKLIDKVTALALQMQKLPPWLLETAVAIGVITAAIGPALLLAGSFARAFAALADLAAPILEGLAGFAEFLLGPWGIAIAAAVAVVILFHDQVFKAIGDLVAFAQQQLGPIFKAIIDQFTAIWTALTTGPLGAAIKQAMDEIGNLIGAIIEIAGSGIIMAIEQFATAFLNVLKVVTDVVNFVSDLMSGDWSKAWDDAVKAVQDAITGILQFLFGAIPGFNQWAASIAKGIMDYFAAPFVETLAWVESVFPGFTKGFMDMVNATVGWAVSLYKQLKPWIDGIADLIMTVIDPMYSLQKMADQMMGKKTAPKAAAAAPPAQPKIAGEKPPALAPVANGDGTFDVTKNDGKDKEAEKIAEATKKLAKEITEANEQINKGMDELTEPKAIVWANDLNQKLDDFVKTAKDAGVNTNAFASQINALRANIDKVKIAGLQKEAEEFARSVLKDQQAVDQFGKGGLAPLDEKLQAVDDTYNNLKAKIEDQIKANQVLADSNADAAKAMDQEKASLVALEAAHTKATQAAKDQYAAEQLIANLQSGDKVNQLHNAAQDAHQARGDNGTMTSTQKNMQDTQRGLTQSQNDAKEAIAQTQKAIIDAQNSNNQEEVARLQEQLKAQEEVYAVVSATSAVQITTAKRLQDAYEQFTDSLSQNLDDMIMNWKGDLSGLLGIFKELANQLFIKPGTDAIAGAIKTGMDSLFSGFHDTGGDVPRGKWGIAGEKGLEIITGGTTGAHVTSRKETAAMLSGRGNVVNQYISTPDPNAFRASKRQVARQARDAIG